VCIIEYVSIVCWCSKSVSLSVDPSRTAGVCIIERVSIVCWSSKSVSLSVDPSRTAGVLECVSLSV